MKEFRLPEYKEIPDVGLFLEQVQRFVSGYLEPLSGVSLTASMISNYVKHGIIGKPAKKQYYREQIAEIFFVAMAKSILSLDDIDFVLELARRESDAESAYNYFRSELVLKLACAMGASETDDDSDAIQGSEAVSKYAVLLSDICTGIAYKLYLNHELGELQK